MKTKLKPLPAGAVLSDSKKNKVPKGRSVSPAQTKWWLMDEQDVYQGVMATTNAMSTALKSFRINLRDCASLYDPSSSPADAASGARAMTAGTVSGTPAVYNVVEQCVNGIGNKLFKDVPRPMFVTENGNGKQQRRAKLLNQYVQGLFDEAQARYAVPRAGFQCLKYGTALVKAYYDDDGFHFDNVDLRDILVDRLEARKRKPRQMHQCSPIDRQCLIEMFPDKEDVINKATLGSEFSAVTQQTTADDVALVESWHLPSGPGAKDGKHSFSVDTGTLLVEAWDHDFFPFAVLRYDETDVGFWGTGIAQLLRANQLHLNMLIKQIDISMKRICKPYILVPSESGIVKDHFSQPGAVITYSEGRVPSFVTPQALDPAVYDQLERETRWAFETTGLSQLSATSQLPASLQQASGVALETYHNIETERFSTFAKRFEQFIIDLAYIAVELTRDIAKDNTDLSVKAASRRFINKIKWKDVSMDADRFFIQVFPVSELPSTPAGRQQKLTQMIQAGWIDRTQAMELLDMPDTDAYTARQTAILDRLNLIIEKMLDDEEYTSPDQYLLGGTDGPKFVLAIINAEINMAFTNGETDAAVQLLDKFYNACLTFPGVQPPALPVAPSAPQARPEALPTSAMLPQG